MAVDTNQLAEKICAVLTMEEHEELLDMFGRDHVSPFDIEFFKRYPHERERMFTPEYIAEAILGG